MKLQIRFLVLTTLFLTLFSCSTDNHYDQSDIESSSQSLNELDGNLITTEVQSSSESYTYITSVLILGETVTGNYTITWDNENEEMISTILEPSLLDALEISQGQFDDWLALETSLEANGNDDDGENAQGPFSQCMEYCQEKYTDENGKRKKGRGNCRLGCWVDAAERIIESIAGAKE